MSIQTDRCTICLKTLRHPTVDFHEHSFHKQCMNDYVQSLETIEVNCPLCRRDITADVENSGIEREAEKIAQIREKIIFKSGFIEYLTRFNNRRAYEETVLKQWKMPAFRHGTISAIIRCDFVENGIRINKGMAMLQMKEFFDTVSEPLTCQDVKHRIKTAFSIALSNSVF